MFTLYLLILIAVVTTILYGAYTISHKKLQKHRPFSYNDKSLLPLMARTELLRIAIFLCVYAAVIVFGFALIYLLGIFTAWAVPLVAHLIMIEIHRRVLLGSILLALAAFFIIALWVMMIKYVYYMLKPIFTTKGNPSYDEGVEITRNDAPELFALIDDVTTRLKITNLKHVYISSDANARVYFNASFCSLFRKADRSMSIGLALFKSTSTDELRAFLGHELGHYAQGDTKITSTTNIACQIISNLIKGDDGLHRDIKKMCTTSIPVMMPIAALMRLLLEATERVMFGMYTFVQSGRMEMSRQMEFEADGIAASIAGADVTISALCKGDVMNTRMEVYCEMLSDYYNETGSLPHNFWSGFDVVLRHLDRLNYEQYTYDRLLTAPHEHSVERRLTFDDVWNAHPDISLRIEALKSNAASSDASADDVSSADGVSSATAAGKPVPAWSIVSEQIIHESSEEALACFADPEFENQLQFTDDDLIDEELIDDDLIDEELTDDDLTDDDLTDDDLIDDADMEADFDEWASDGFDKYAIPYRYQPYLLRDIQMFSMKELNAEKVKERPVNAANERKLLQYEQAEVELDVMQRFNNGTLRAKGGVKIDTLRYDGKVYTVGKAPVGEHKAYVSKLREEATKIDRRICAYVMKVDGNRDRVNEIYTAIFYSQMISKIMTEQIDPCHDSLFRDLFPAVDRTEKQQKELKENLLEFFTKLQKAVSKIDLSRFDVLTEDMSETLNEFLAFNPTGQDEIYDEKITLISETMSVLHKMITNQIFSSKRKIVDLLER